MEIRKATYSDAPLILNLFDDARCLFKLSGIPQWNNNYPNIDTINADISQGNCYVLLEKSFLIGTAVIMSTPDQYYKVMDEGQWLSDNDQYLTIHRITISNQYRGQELATLFFNYALQLGKDLGYHSIRIDTHAKNIGMQKWIKKCGFVECGVVHVSDKTPRNTYEYLF